MLKLQSNHIMPPVSMKLDVSVDVLLLFSVFFVLYLKL